MTLACFSIVLTIFITGYAFADISTFPDNPNSPVCKRALWVYLRGSSLAFVILLVVLGHVSVQEVKRIARDKGISSVSYNSLWLALYMNVVCEIVCTF